MQMLQQDMAGEAERTGLVSEDDVMTLVKNSKETGCQAAGCHSSFRPYDIFGSITARCSAGR